MAKIDGLGRLCDADETISNTSGTVDFSYGFVYDMRSQLKQASIEKNSGPYRNAEYNYRKDGNLDSRTINSSTTNFTYAGDLMDTASGGEGFDLDWDDNGNMTTGASETFTYNWDNKLRSSSALSGNIRYDPSGSRVRKLSVVAGDRKYLVDIVGDLPTTLMEMTDTDNTILKTYIYANGQVLCQHDGDYSAPCYFYIHDRLGSVRQIIDSSGNVKNHYIYEPFGELLDSETQETISNPFKFTGQYFDSEISQYYLRARQYDQHIYRFTSRDPVSGKFEEPMTLHVYLYCLNDPINKIDPSGLWAYYITGGFLGSLGFSGAGQAGIVWDDQGNWGIIGIGSYGGGLPASASAGMNFGITNAETILHLRGSGWAAGGGGSVSFFGAGAEYIWSKQYKGIEFNIGAGISYPVGFEGHIHRTHTYVFPVHSQTLSFEDIVGMAAVEAFYKATTYGEARFIIHFMEMTDVDFGVLM